MLGEEEPYTVRCYTVPEAAKALGKDTLTFKRWIKEGMIPEPVLTDTSRGYAQYSVGELNVVADVLVQHATEYRYYAKSHDDTRLRLLEELEAYRDEFI